TLVAAFLRFYRLGEWSFWIEEHHSRRHSLATYSLGELLGHPRPLFYLLLKPILTTFGSSEWTARLLPAFVGTISIPVLFWLVKRIFDPWTAILSASLLAIAPWHIYWSQNARFYIL